MHTCNEHPGSGLHAYLDKELSPEGALEVEHHLSECAVCRVTRTVRLRQGRRTLVMGGASGCAAAVPAAADHQHKRQLATPRTRPPASAAGTSMAITPS